MKKKYIYIYERIHRENRGFPSGASGKEPTCQYRRHKRCRFDPWVVKVSGGGHDNPLQYSFFFFFSTPVFLPGESHG